MSHLGAITKLLKQRAMRKPRTESAKARMARERKRKERELLNAVYKREVQRWKLFFAGKTPTGKRFLELLTITRTKLQFGPYTFSPKVGFTRTYRTNAIDLVDLSETALCVFDWLTDRYDHYETRLTLLRSMRSALLKAFLLAFEPPHRRRLQRGGALTMTLELHGLFETTVEFTTEWEK